VLILHDPQCAEYGAPGHPERPGRVLATADRLRAAAPSWEWRVPEATADDVLLLAHTQAHLRRLEEPGDFDADTAAFPGIGGHARRAVGAAVAAAEHALDTHDPVFSLMRPPGHHATADRAMGFCYLNQVAVAAVFARQRLGLARVAVWDFDAHHGNGTEEILGGRPGFLYCSVHEHPCYPGTGELSRGNCRNWPVPPHAPRDRHLQALGASWDAIVGFRPDLVLVSAGFDAYAGDPITEMSLEAGDFGDFGRWIHRSGLPVAAVLEGGYSDDLPGLVEVFLRAWAD
jgi:acetoin utilization deacetylase AcuC-like enzyme